MINTAGYRKRRATPDPSSPHPHYLQNKAKWPEKKLNRNK
jgi:hypothetical protein